MSTSENRGVKVVPFDGNNYTRWKFRINALMRAKGVYEFITDSPPAAPANPDDVAIHNQKKSIACAMIINSMTESTIKYIENLDGTDPRALWTALEDQFNQDSDVNKSRLWRSLFTIRMTENQDINEYIAYLNNLVSQLTALGQTVPEGLQWAALSHGLTDEYENMVTSIEAVGTLGLSDKLARIRTFSERKRPVNGNFSESAFQLDEKPKRHEARFGKQSERNSTTGLNGHKKISKNGDLKTKKPGTCNYCGKPGHWYKECRSRIKDNKKNNFIDDKKRANQATEQNYDVFSMVAREQTSTYHQEHSEWLIDSGATSHMTSNRSYFSDLQPVSINISVADDRTVTAAGIGTVILTVKNQQTRNKTSKIALERTLYVPSLGANLLAVSPMVSNGATVTFTEQGCVVKKGNIHILKGERQGKAYKVSTATYVNGEQSNVAHGSYKNNLQLWHQRLGHANVKGIINMRNNETVTGLDFNEDRLHNVCGPCMAGKQHRNKFPHASSTRSTYLLELVHSDVSGPMSVHSHGGALYFITFICDCSRRVTVYTMRRKDQALDLFKRFLQEEAIPNGLHVQTLRTDYGGEYTSKAFRNF